MMAKRSASCAACLRVQQRLNDAAQDGSATLKCHFGMSESAVPVKLGEQTIGYLATGRFCWHCAQKSTRNQALAKPISFRCMSAAAIME